MRSWTIGPPTAKPYSFSCEEALSAPGCFSAGDTLDEALDAVVEAIELHLEGMAADGEVLPRPQPLAAHRANPDYADGVWAVVQVVPVAKAA